MTRGDFHLGGVVDPQTGERTGERVVQPAHHLTTHGFIVGMTGSGKTGLGVILLEEALLSGIPVLVLDPKGDMGNLLLTFPELRPADFRPWVDAAEARRKGVDVDAFATSTAAAWKEGLASWDIGPDRIRRLRDAANFTIYTPGSSAGTPLSMLGSLEAPTLRGDAHVETMREEIEGFVSSLLTIAGADADPLSSPAHILVASVIEHVWQEGRDLELGNLIRLIQDPPFRKLGVFALDDFYPATERQKLARRLNALLASPSFASWLEGRPLNLDSLVHGPDGRPGAAIVYLAHLSDAERQFVVTLVLTRLITWMRQQPGTSDLRLLVYMDEMFGFAPPTAEPPSKKPILTIFKQARAHGVGMVVSTQNPVDVDYKVIANAGTWMLGRLQTERDKARVLEGLRSAGGSVDMAAVDSLLGGLRQREFVLRTTRSAEPTLFTTRWAMSYLRGSLTREEVTRLAGTATAEAIGTAGGARAAGERGAAEEQTEQPASPGSALAEDESSLPPSIPSAVPVYHLDLAAPWAADVGAVPGSRRLEPALVARLQLTFDDHHADLDHREEWEAVFFPLGAHFDAESGIAVDYDDRDFRSAAPDGARYVLSDAPITQASFFRDAGRAIQEHVYRNRQLAIFRNRELKLYSRAGEERDAFVQRCRHAAAEQADREAAGLRDRYEKKAARLRDAIARADARVRELDVDVSARKQQEIVAGAGKLISMFMRGRASATALSGAASRRSMTRRTEERLRTAADRQADQEAGLQDLEVELEDELSEIVDRWEARAEQVEIMEVGLEKNDIAVDRIGLLWIPR